MGEHFAMQQALEAEAEAEEDEGEDGEEEEEEEEEDADLDLEDGEGAEEEEEEGEDDEEQMFGGEEDDGEEEGDFDAEEDEPLDPANLAQADLMSRQQAQLGRLLAGVSNDASKKSSKKNKAAPLVAGSAKARALSDFGEVDHKAEMARNVTGQFLHAALQQAARLVLLYASLLTCFGACSFFLLCCVFFSRQGHRQAGRSAGQAQPGRGGGGQEEEAQEPVSHTTHTQQHTRTHMRAHQDRNSHFSASALSSVCVCSSLDGDEEGAADDDEAGGWGAKKAKKADDAGAALYAKMKATKAESKELRKSVYEPLVLPANWKTMSEDDRRAVSRQIKANRGLVRSRPKDRKNPKTANRLRYEKRLVARSGAVQEFKGSQAANYGGQATGIKTTLTKSISLRS